jgi:hypothetical protein
MTGQPHATPVEGINLWRGEVGQLNATDEWPYVMIEVLLPLPDCTGFETVRFAFIKP